MSFNNFTNQQEHSFSETYLEIKPNELLQYVDKFGSILDTQVTVYTEDIGYTFLLNGIKYQTRRYSGCPLFFFHIKHKRQRKQYGKLEILQTNGDMITL